MPAGGAAPAGGGVADAALIARIAELEKWGTKLQEIAKKQYPIYQKVKEYYGDMYDFGAPVAKQELDAKPP